jgi:pimeloyl-ACP methyl ester carboxylesterase
MCICKDTIRRRCFPEESIVPDAATTRRTNIRVPAMAMATLATTFTGLERLAPWAGAALAERLWCRVRAPKGNGRHDLRPGAGEVISVLVDGRRVVAEAWGVGPVVYFSAGWGGGRGQLGGLVTPVVEAGFRVVAFDPLSHGDSAAGAMGPRHGTMSEFAESLAAVARVAGPAHAIVAHSAGCVSAGLAVGAGLPAERLVFIAPMADPVPYLNDFCHIFHIGPRTRARLFGRLERRGGRPLADFDLLQRGSQDNPPVLVIHDRDDKETRFSDGEAIAAAWPAAELMATRGLGHRRILADPVVASRITEFLTSQTRTPPADTAAAR